MSENATPRVRRSLTDLQDDYNHGKKKPLEDLMRAWKGIKELPPEDARSFFVLGGYHGEPFRGAGWGNASYWGGYCMHGNILFPSWHRFYLLKLEQALQSIPCCAEVMLPFWDECSKDSLNNGIPWALTQEDFQLDGQTIANPLRSFMLPANLVDNISGDDPNYGKPKGYETVRYPLSGLVGNDGESAKTKAHNAQYPDYATNVKLLNQNIVNWLHHAIIVDGKPVHTGVNKKYQTCLDAPNYTVFSNTTSAAQWNQNLAEGAAPVVPLESPHNSIHLAVGGFDVPNQGDSSPIAGANGDMGENDTAGLDPIFFFHHCFVDRVFWLWQKKHHCTDKLDVIAQYPGTNSVDSQGPTPGVAPNSWLTLESPLDPFRKADGTAVTTRDCVNIETQLGYTYGPGSLEDQTELAALAALPAAHSTKVVRVGGINRGAVRGSFMISAFAIVGGNKQHLGTEAVLSRWHVDGCANCQTHLEAKAFIGLHGFSETSLHDAHFDVEVRTRDGLLTLPRAALALAAKKPFYFEVR